ncbi:outer membrane beta-barrel protein [Labilibaculum euxinus]
MKLFFTICAFFCCVVIASAQTEQGKFLFGGNSNMNFSSMNNKWKSDDGDEDLGSTTSFEFAPQVGYFVADGFAVGLELPIGMQTEKDKDDNKYKTNRIAVMPFARYYFGENNVKPYLHGGFGFGSMKYKDVSASAESKWKTFVYGVSGGVAIFLNNNIALDLGVGYQSVTLRPDEDRDNDPRRILSSVAFNVGFSISL